MDTSSILYIFETIVSKGKKVDKDVTFSFHLLNFIGG